MKQTAKILSLYSRIITVSLNTDHNPLKSTIRIYAHINTNFIWYVGMYTSTCVYQQKVYYSTKNKDHIKRKVKPNHYRLLKISIACSFY